MRTSAPMVSSSQGCCALHQFRSSFAVVISDRYGARRWALGVGRSALYNETMLRRNFQLAVVLATTIGAAAGAMAQTPVPFPKPAEPQKPAGPGGTKVAPPATPMPQAPTEATLGMPIYPA